MKTIISFSEKETKEFAQKIAKKLHLPAIICLYGNLGSGKTTFTKGLGAALGIPEKKISPLCQFMKELHLS
jgi:tRNA threonylcarbamoyladenosine biosynthesis protein TsaE